MKEESCKEYCARNNSSIMDLNKLGLSATTLLCFRFYRCIVFMSCKINFHVIWSALQNSVRPAMHVLTQTINKSNKRLSCLFFWTAVVFLKQATERITFRVYIYSGITAQIALVVVLYQAPLVWHWFSRNQSHSKQQDENLNEMLHFHLN